MGSRSLNGGEDGWSGRKWWMNSMLWLTTPMLNTKVTFVGFGW